MKVLNLRCHAQHPFEGWFGSEADYRGQLARGLVACPMCGDTRIEKLLSAPRINLGAAPPALTQTSAATTPAPVAMAPQMDAAAHARMLRALREMVARSEDVGDRFADEARRMHHGDTQARQIRGRASMADTLELLEEGVPVLPLPALVKETLQ